MKKTYINPVIDVVKVQMQQMLAASLQTGEEYQSDQQTLGRDFDFDDED